MKNLIRMNLYVEKEILNIIVNMYVWNIYIEYINIC